MNYNCISVVLCLFIAAECINGTSVTTELSPLDVSLGEPWTLKCVVCLSGGDVLGGVNVYHKPVGKTVFEPITRNWKSGNISVTQLDFLLRSKLTWTKDQSTLSLAVRDHWPRDKGVYRCSVTITGKTTPVTDDKQYPVPNNTGGSTTVAMVTHDILLGQPWALQCAIWLTNGDAYEGIQIYFKPLGDVSFKPLTGVTETGQAFIIKLDLISRSNLTWDYDKTVLSLTVEQYLTGDSGMYRCSLKVKNQSAPVTSDTELLHDMLTPLYSKCQIAGAVFCILQYENFVDFTDVEEMCLAGNVLQECVEKSRCAGDPRVKKVLGLINESLQNAGCTVKKQSQSGCDVDEVGVCKLDFETAVETAVSNSSKLYTKSCRLGQQFMQCVQKSGCTEDAVIKAQMTSLDVVFNQTTCAVTPTVSTTAATVCLSHSFEACRSSFIKAADAAQTKDTECLAGKMFIKCVENAGCTSDGRYQKLRTIFEKRSGCVCNETSAAECRQTLQTTLDSAARDKSTTVNSEEICRAVRRFVACVNRSHCINDYEIKKERESLENSIKQLSCATVCSSHSFEACRSSFEKSIIGQTKDKKCQAGRMFIKCVENAGCTSDGRYQKLRTIFEKRSGCALPNEDIQGQ